MSAVRAAPPASDVPPPPPFDRDTWLVLLLVTVAASLVYVLNFSHPAVPFWDERYYIVAAQKYLHGVYFIDLHPPLGKLLITLRERLFGQNAETTQFLNVTYYATDVPAGLSLLGLRCFRRWRCGGCGPIGAGRSNVPSSWRSRAGSSSFRCGRFTSPWHAT